LDLNLVWALRYAQTICHTNFDPCVQVLRAGNMYFAASTTPVHWECSPTSPGTLVPCLPPQQIHPLPPHLPNRPWVTPPKLIPSVPAHYTSPFNSLHYSIQPCADLPYGTIRISILDITAIPPPFNKDHPPQHHPGDQLPPPILLPYMTWMDIIHSGRLVPCLIGHRQYSSVLDNLS